MHFKLYYDENTQTKGNNIMFEQIREIVSKELHVSPDEIQLETNLVEDLGADSLSLVTVVMTVEDTLGVSFPDEVAYGFKTPKDIIDYLEANK